MELVDRSELTEPVILIADRGYEAYNNIAHIEQKGWNYLIRVKEKQGILSSFSNCTVGAKDPPITTDDLFSGY